MLPIEILKGARELLAKPGVWIQDESARDENGHRVDPHDSRACMFCSAGALDHIEKTKSQRTGVVYTNSSIAAQELDKTIHTWYDPEDCEDFVMFNDLGTTRLDDVLRMFDTTIERLEKRDADNNQS